MTRNVDRSALTAVSTSRVMLSTAPRLGLPRSESAYSVSCVTVDCRYTVTVPHILSPSSSCTSSSNGDLNPAETTAEDNLAMRSLPSKKENCTPSMGFTTPGDEMCTARLATAARMRDAKMSPLRTPRGLLCARGIHTHSHPDRRHHPTFTPAVSLRLPISRFHGRVMSSAPSSRPRATPLSTRRFSANGSHCFSCLEGDRRTRASKSTCAYSLHVQYSPVMRLQVRSSAHYANSWGIHVSRPNPTTFISPNVVRYSGLLHRGLFFKAQIALTVRNILAQRNRKHPMHIQRCFGHSKAMQLLLDGFNVLILRISTFIVGSSI